MPFVTAIVLEVDVAAGVLVIDPPPGLLEPRAGPGKNHGPFCMKGGRGPWAANKPHNVAHRHRDDLSRLLRRPAAGFADREGGRPGRHRVRRPRPAVLGHRCAPSVDDAPFGGGPGMVMRPDVWGDALDDPPGGPPGLGWWCPAQRAAVHPAHGVPVRCATTARVRLRPLRGHRRAGRRGQASGRPVVEVRLVTSCSSVVRSPSW